MAAKAFPPVVEDRQVGGPQLDGEFIQDEAEPEGSPDVRLEDPQVAQGGRLVEDQAGRVASLAARIQIKRFRQGEIEAGGEAQRQEIEGVLIDAGKVLGLEHEAAKVGADPEAARPDGGAVAYREPREKAVAEGIRRGTPQGNADSRSGGKVEASGFRSGSGLCLLGGVERRGAKGRHED